MPRNTSGLRPPWKPGQSGNPGGRPKKRPITDEYFALADIEIPKEICRALRIKFVPGRTFSQANALRRFMDALKKGGYRDSREIREAIEGKSPMRLEISGPEKKEITIEVRFVNRIPLPEQSSKLPQSSTESSTK